jgi:3',5'-cyclic AMP phosphodiesterase CpdA
MDTTVRFEAALKSAAERHRDADLCVFAGDIADQAEPDAYRMFDQMRTRYSVPQCVTLGNHDDRNIFLASVEDAVTDPNDYVQCARDTKGHRVLVLDSSEPGKERGGFPAPKLNWVAEQLVDAASKDLKVIVVLHHNPAALQMPVDTYRLEHPDELLAVLKESGADILQVVAGHCHISSAGSWGGLPCATLAGNHHRVEPFLRGRTGRQQCYEGPAHYGVIVSNGSDCAVHFESYIGEIEPMDGALFPRKLDQAFERL